ncbi:MAG: hypothetical protein Q8O13_10975, partial [Candidatus Omnitrophota bacterium]|nr:hypothetical protein [Candidatus Omnitrophota bacterium]
RTIRLFVFGEFWEPAKFAKHYVSSTSQKFFNPEPNFVLIRGSKKIFLFYIGGGEKFIKGVFARFRPPQPPVVIHRSISGGWKAESPHPPKAVFVLGAHSSATYSPACAQSLLSP